ncbi:MAG: GNAT family N-acetyltransferase [Alphaproteobacteria bacterium]
MSAVLDIRAAGPADAEAIVALNRRVAAEAAQFLAYDIDPVTGADMLKAKLAAGPGGDRVLVAAAAEGTLVGMLLLRRHLHHADQGVRQLGLAVDPDRRRQGIGRRLVRTALVSARAASVRRIQIAVVADNRPALDLFHREGFSIEGRLVEAAEIDGRRIDVLAMGLRLESLPPPPPAV